jgi:predicted  nucleic acid-binding Zn-ribbon protein
MKTALKILALSALAIAISGFGVNAAEKGSATKTEVKKDVAEAVDATKKYTEEQKKLYAKKIEEQLIAIDKEIGLLEEKAKNAKKDAAEKIRAGIQDLKAKQKAAQQSLSDLKSSTSGGWSDIKAGLDKAMGVLSDAYNNAKKELK